jgi:hypothetical protein
VIRNARTHIPECARNSSIRVPTERGTTVGVYSFFVVFAGAGAESREVRRKDAHAGFVATEVLRCAQDDKGFIFLTDRLTVC